MLGKHVDTETRRAISEQLEQHEALKRKIRGIESDESESDLAESEDEDPETARANALKALGVLEQEVEEAEGNRPAKGVFAMKFMQRGLEQQMKESREQVRRAMEEMEDDERAEVDSDNDGAGGKDEDQDAGAGKLVAQNSGRMVFGSTNAKKGVKPATLAESDGSDEEEVHEDSTFRAQASGPIRVGVSKPTDTVKTDAIFPVQQFELEETTEGLFIGNANKRQLGSQGSDAKPIKRSSDPAPPAAKATVSDDSETEETFTIDKRPTQSARSRKVHNVEDENPWLQADDDSKPVKKSTRTVNDKNLGKTERAMEKLARERKNARRAELEESVGDVQLNLGGIKQLEQTVDDGMLQVVYMPMRTSL